MCLLRMDLAGILQNPPNLDSPGVPAPRWGCLFSARFLFGEFLFENENPPVGRVLDRHDVCRSIYLEARSRASLSSRSIFC